MLPHTLISSLLLSLSLAFFSGCGARSTEVPPASPADPALMQLVEERLEAFASIVDVQKRIPGPIAFNMLQEYVAANPEIYGSALAMAPDKSDFGTGRSCPYVHRSGEAIVRKNLVDSYNYLAEPWYTRAAELGKPVWSEPYFDRGGGDIWMITYSVPLYAPGGSLVGVLTSDLPASAPQG